MNKLIPLSSNQIDMLHRPLETITNSNDILWRSCQWKPLRKVSHKNHHPLNKRWRPSRYEDGWFTSIQNTAFPNRDFGTYRMLLHLLRPTQESRQTLPPVAHDRKAASSTPHQNTSILTLASSTSLYTNLSPPPTSLITNKDSSSRKQRSLSSYFIRGLERKE